jgi:hypothetical protein
MTKEEPMQPMALEARTTTGIYLLDSTTPVPLHSINLETFWRLADDSRMAAEYRVDANLRYLQVAPPDVLRKVFIQYRFFTIFYITDLALLVAKMPFGTLRSGLAEFLAEELGDGEPSESHPRLYDDFLVSLGLSPAELERANANCLTSLQGIRDSLVNRSWAYGVGLRGMGGECLCQIYLSSMYENFIQNPFIQSRKDSVAWKFWDIHTGEVDIVHRERTRAAITDLIRSEPSLIKELAAGYLESKAAWDWFWKNIFDAAVPRG